MQEWKERLQKQRPGSRLSPGLVAVHMEKPTPGSPPLHNTGHYWSPHSPATLISIIWQNESTYSFLAYLCCSAFWLPSKHHSSCTNAALSILGFPLHRFVEPSSLCDTPSIIHSPLQAVLEEGPSGGQLPKCTFAASCSCSVSFSLSLTQRQVQTPFWDFCS